MLQSVKDVQTSLPQGPNIRAGERRLPCEVFSSWVSVPVYPQRFSCETLVVLDCAMSRGSC